VHYYEGTVANLSPEGFTALFGAPIAHEDDPARALHAALSIKEHLEARPEGLSLRAGLNTGLVIVGAIGDDLSMEYTAIGDTVSLASCLRDVSKRGAILASEDTHHLTQGYFDFAEAGGIESQGETVSIYQVLAPTSADTRVEASLSKGLSHFVGREKELAHLSECLEKAREGQGQVVGVVGEAGVGKSRLVLEFLKGFPSDQYTLLQGGCYHYGEAIPYLPLIELLKDYFGIEGSDDQASIKEKMELALRLAGPTGNLRAALPPLSELFSLPVEDEAFLSLEPQQRREQLVSAVRQLLATEGQRRPMVIVLEDLHWMDRTSEEFLGTLIDGITNSCMLLILLYRPEYISPWTSKSYYSTVRVDQLPEKTSSELITSILSEGEVSPDITELIAGRASGNPLFIEELTHGLLEDGSIRKDDGRYVISGKPSELEVPDTIQGIIAARLDRLQEDLKRLMQAASVIGREFAYRLLEAITQMQEELKSSLADLEESELIYEKSLFPELEYIFKHALTQEVAYNSLLKKKRRELHESIGQAIEGLYPERIEEFYEILAYHYSRSDNAGKAVCFLKLSGDKAVKNYSNWEAIRFYEEAIQVLDAQPETEERIREKIGICLSIWDPITLLSYPEGSIEALQEAERLAEELGDEVCLANIYSKTALYHTMKGNTSLGLEYSEKYFDEAEKIGAIDSMAEAAVGICGAHFFAADVVKVADIGRRVTPLLEEQNRGEDLYIGGSNITTTLSGFYGMALGILGGFEEARDVFEKGLKDAVEVDDMYGIGYVEVCYSNLFFWEGDGHGLINHARRAIECFEEIGNENILGQAWSFLGAGYFLLGEHETARDHAEKGARLQKETGMPVVLPFVYYLFALIHLTTGNFENARDCAEESLKLSRDFRTKYYEGWSLTALGRIAGEADPSKTDVAEQYIRQGISMAEEMKMRPLSAIGHLFLGEVFELAGRREKAIENLKIAEQMGKEMGMGYWLTRTQEALVRLDEHLV
jgi:tetratricopeptide (TPR) repeat protein